MIGIRNDATRKKLLEDRKLDLKKAINIFKSCEAASEQLRDTTQNDVNFIDKARKQQLQYKQLHNSKQRTGRTHHK